MRRNQGRLLQPLAVEQRSEPNEALAIQNESGKALYEPNEAAIQNEASEAAFKNEGASDAPESGQKEDNEKFSPKDVKQIRKIKKMSFRPG